PRYGGDEVDTTSHSVSDIRLSPDSKSVRFQVGGLRVHHVFELRTHGLKSNSGQRLKHPNAWYTLNRIPGK
ncbi:hypothetical protein N9B65_08070, partial [Akkermansiaceae bacterium]|nr:hypothetical protein [Akkermansiaceae bacterium]